MTANPNPLVLTGFDSYSSCHNTVTKLMAEARDAKYESFGLCFSKD